MKSMFQMLKQRSESRNSRSDINNENGNDINNNMNNKSIYLPSRSRSNFKATDHWTSENAYNTFDQGRSRLRTRTRLAAAKTKENEKLLYNLTTTLNDQLKNNQNSKNQLLPKLENKNKILEESLYYDSRELTSSNARRIKNIDNSIIKKFVKNSVFNKVKLISKEKISRAAIDQSNCETSDMLKHSNTPLTRNGYAQQQISSLKTKLGVSNRKKQKFKLLDPNDTDIEESSGDRFQPPVTPPEESDSTEMVVKVENHKNVEPEIDFNIFEESEKYDIDVKEYTNNAKKMQNVGFKNFILDHEDRINKTLNKIESESNVKVRDRLIKYLEMNNMFRNYNYGVSGLFLTTEMSSYKII